MVWKAYNSALQNKRSPTQFHIIYNEIRVQIDENNLGAIERDECQDVQIKHEKYEKENRLIIN